MAGSGKPRERDPAAKSGGARKQFPLRLSPELMEELRSWANAELRSLNGQIEFLLRQAVQRRRGEGEG